jgi:hypothetical protein
MFFFQCKNKFTTSDEQPSTQTLGDTEMSVRPQSFGLLDLKKNFRIASTAVFKVKNGVDLKGKFTITKDGYLAYTAPEKIGQEIIELEVSDTETGEAQLARVLVNIESTPINYGPCYVDIGVEAVGSTPLTFDLNKYIQEDTLCGNTPTGEFEVIFPPVELQYTVDGSQVTVYPNPGGIDMDYIAYKGNYIGQDSSYIRVIFLTNQTGCFPYPIWDNYQFQYSPDSTSYVMDVMENEQLCGLPQDSSWVYGLSKYDLPGGTLSLEQRRYVRFTPNASFQLPFAISFEYFARVERRLGSVLASSLVGLEIKN